jgi:hypothetical protein
MEERPSDDIQDRLTCDQKSCGDRRVGVIVQLSSIFGKSKGPFDAPDIILK